MIYVCLEAQVAEGGPHLFNHKYLLNVDCMHEVPEWHNQFSI